MTSASCSAIRLVYGEHGFADDADVARLGLRDWHAGYATGTRSSWKTRQRCEQAVVCQVIVSEDTPDFHAISEFLRRHLAAFEFLFVEVLRLAGASGLLKVEWLALDGTKIKPFSEIASGHGLVSSLAMGYDRRQTGELRRQHELRKLLAQAATAD